MHTTAIINQKGGVGKSTTAHALGAGLLLRGRSVLYIDLDAQGNLSYALGLEGAAPGAMEVLQGQASLQDALKAAPLPDHAPLGTEASLLPACPALSGADVLLTQTGKEYRLREALETVAGAYDFCIVDTPPALGILTINALTAAQHIIIPAQADIYSLSGIGGLWSTIDAVRKYTNPTLSILGILLTRYTARSVLSRDMAQMTSQTAQSLQTELFTTPIREGVAVKEAQASRKDIFSWAPKSNAALDYESFVGEVLERLGK